MTTPTPALLATVVALLALPPAYADETRPLQLAEASPPEKQARCRKACDEALAQLRRTRAEPGRDQARKDELERKVVTLIEENRRKGVDDCVTWGQVMGIAFSQ